MSAIMLTSCGGRTEKKSTSTNNDLSNDASTSNQTALLNKVNIGKQVWMSENLNVDKFRNGDPIPEAKTALEWEKAEKEGKPAWCYYDNDPKNGLKYGKLYNWHAVNDSRGLAPSGWHVPSDADWSELINFLDPKAEGGNKIPNTAGRKMKSNTGWNTTNNASNQSGFSGLPGGNRSCLDGAFYTVGIFGSWWSSTEYNKHFAGLINLENLDDVLKMECYKGEGYSVRCLRN